MMRRPPRSTLVPGTTLFRSYLRPKVKIECVVAERDVQTIVDTVLKHGRTGAVGDGKVFVMPVDEAYRVRIGEAGEEILQDRKSTRLNSSHANISYAVFCLKK